MILQSLIFTCLLSSFVMSGLASDVEVAFAEHEIPKALGVKAPTKLLEVSYDGQPVNLSQTITPDQARVKPDKVDFESEPNQLYTLVMIDPDAPSRKSPSMGEWKHWLVVNLPSADLTKGTTVTEYMGPSPPAGTGLHRYVFLLFKQPGKIDVQPSSSRAKFKVAQFAEQHGLGDPVAGNFFQAETA